MHKLILNNYEKELLKKLEAKGRKYESGDKLEFIMNNLDALVVKTNGEGETDTTADSEPVWGQNPSSETTSKKESYYLPLTVKRMVFNLLYPDGIIEEPTYVEGGNYVTRVTARVFENPEMYEKGIPLGTFSKEYYWKDFDSNADQIRARVDAMSLARGAVLTRAIGFGAGIGYETINSYSLENGSIDTNNLIGEKEAKKAPKKGVGEDKKTMDEFKSFVKKPEPAPIEAEETVAPTEEPCTSSKPITSSAIPSFNGKTLEQIYDSKGVSGLVFLAKNCKDASERGRAVSFLKGIAELHDEVKEILKQEKLA